MIFKSVRNLSNKVCDVLVSFGVRQNKTTFISHPGVMVVSQLLEMRLITRPRATLTQENVNAMVEFDYELAKKAQIAVDNNLPVNFFDLEYIDRPEYLKLLLEEKEILEKARDEVLKMQKGNYKIPDILKNYKRVEIPREWRKELEIDDKILKEQPGLKENIELQNIMNNYIRNKFHKNKDQNSKKEIKN
ncbi:hypothetical protein C923_02529 [Plasmodium falciparum UGT5.1]|uniref:Cytochrome c oxidase subunit ApiCOX30, putative n=4 Tax=Plasmodium falciparum TaxID=5833 RepID=Q8I2Z5_PLAF7|nr:cytochrome c oxidase subunit ApiCOX30, putative [Plasmodium falciparum 3D7]ETW43098.1 hypothetical protein PFNF135_02573 [Plasmodium falciparum NF135/5.C10]EWC76738.1 hypothetical protein C923_02529 [Plasmodium falciparum UGT5.1]KAF4330814.1 hypothetical protein CYL21_1189 [Plasmodium falciparum NF54]PKC45039.1 hypothetical protein CK202_4030 [Plasmodium falciparum NF54]CAD51840.1 cytochrome c oxidase subunit ApiCOX30, putative [Plasmodium falciparum 3D7]|eukprot:XP_001352029.1 conserved Plasmodium protein, unknown function [Plasmodium falciparum 3D7]